MNTIKLGKRLLALSTVGFLLCNTIAKAQKGKPEYFKNLPRYSWVDGSHYKYYEDGKYYLVDAASGEQTILKKSTTVPTTPTIFINSRANEIVYKKQGKTVKITAIQNAQFSPNHSLIAFTKNSWRATHDGSATVYNGKSSWVYNEEILGRGTKYKAFWWSPDGKYLAFMRFDDSKVPVHILYRDTGVHGSYVSEHYPQPGDPNPEVKLGIINIEKKQIVWAGFNAQADQYFGTPIWRPDSKALWAQWMNRRQDTLKIEAINLTNGRLKNIYTESQKTWIALDLENRITFLPKRNMFLLQSDKDGWMHLYAYSMKGKLIKQLTKGDWAVENIEYIDKQNGWIYFNAKKEQFLRKDFYKVRLDGTGLQRLTFGAFSHNIKMSPSGKYFITNYSNYNTPDRIALVKNNGQLIRQLADSRGKDYARFTGNRDEILYVETKDGFKLPVRVKWPQHLDTTKKYPILVHIYGGPDRCNVYDDYRSNSPLNNRYSNIIQVTMDHRGSGLFGKKGEDYLYGHLGKWEIHDYSAVIKWLEHHYSFIDTARVGITGFSFGGYLTCLALAKAADVFTCGIAGGSVTDWRLYDSHYTERYMGLPKDNPKGYKEASVMTYVKNYKGVLRLEQGTMGDNVHMQNTLQLVTALINNVKHFELMLYPGTGHGWLLNNKRFKHTNNEKNRFINKYLLGKNEK